ncbi:MAG: carboxypeptidase-like regulatory domain-containing protein [Saprospiraceae bacterium]|nr:carboxypeptidase-like regulatory domain-containing protein [Candidatus Brachybacter algidus]
MLKLEDESPATGASVYITSAIDSTIVKASVVDENGKFTLEDIGAGEYLLHAALIGYTPFENKISVVGDIEVEKINLVPSANQLNEVTIKYKKPLIERDRDKIVVNVENSILAAGNSAKFGFFSRNYSHATNLGGGMESHCNSGSPLTISNLACFCTVQSRDISILQQD